MPIKSKEYSDKKVLQSADFRNVEFLNDFVSEGGQIVPRSKTKLQAKVHRHLARQIKTARVMALLPHSGGLWHVGTSLHGSCAAECFSLAC